MKVIFTFIFHCLINTGLKLYFHITAKLFFTSVTSHHSVSDFSYFSLTFLSLYIISGLWTDRHKVQSSKCNLGTACWSLIRFTSYKHKNSQIWHWKCKNKLISLIRFTLRGSDRFILWWQNFYFTEKWLELYIHLILKKKKQYLRLHRKFKATIDLNQPSLTIFRVVTDILYVPKKPVILNRDLRSLVQTSYLVCIR